jgi:hypothetical protein
LNKIQTTGGLRWRSPDGARHRRHRRSPFGIIVHDHIIVGKNGHAGLKGLKLI